MQYLKPQYQKTLKGGRQLHRNQTAGNSSVVGSHLPPQEVKVTQGQKPVHYSIKKPATASQKNCNTTLHAYARRNTQTVTTERK